MHDKTAFIAIIKENENLIYKVARIYASGREDGEDLYQEIVYQLWKSFPSFKNDAKITTWMYRVALNTSLAYLGKQKKRREHTVINEVLLNKTETNDAAEQERLEALYAQIKKLNAAEKGIVLLYLEGKTYEEIASLTGFTVTNIGTRLGRIKQKIITQIKK